jgi:acetolactate synthase-1/2/3 large subunit
MRNAKVFTGGKIIYEKLKEQGVRDVFMYTGGAVMPLVDAFYQGDIRYYINTHEQSGGHAATAYAKSTGRPGVSIVTSGPGFTNSVTALADAMYDSTPLILFSGQVPLQAQGTQAFQECSSVEVSSSITKWSYCVEKVEDIPRVVDEAFRVALDGKPGPVHIDLPKCIIAGPGGDGVSSIEFTNKRTVCPELDKGRVKAVAELIKRARRPVIIAGKGCNEASELLRALANKASIPVTTTLHAMGCFDETDPLALQFMGMHGNVAANYAVQNADLVMALGTRFDDRITGQVQQFAPKAFEAFRRDKGGIVHVNFNRGEIDKVIASHLNFHSDCSNFLEELLPHVKASSWRRKKWLDEIALWGAEHPFDYHRENRMKTQEVICAISEYFLTHETDHMVTTGVGNHQMMAAQFIKWRQPGRFISSGSLGVMGTGLPYAIGCQIAHPDRLVLDIDGDGSFNHTLTELKTVRDYGLPIKIAILNDECLSMVRAWEELFYQKRYTATDLKRNPDYVALANSFGIPAMSCDNRGDVHQTVTDFLEAEGPMLCEFKVISDLCLPLVKPGAALDNMQLFNSDTLDTFENQLPPG